MNLRSVTIPFVTGKPIADYPLNLANGIAYIQNVDIDNTEGTGPIYLYIGVESVAPGLAYKTIAAGSRQSYNIQPVQSCCLHFPNIPLNSGAVQVSWQDTSQSALVGVATQSILSQYPSGAVPWSVDNAFTLVGAGGSGAGSNTTLSLNIKNGTVQAGMRFYLTFVSLYGLRRQAWCGGLNFYDAGGAKMLLNGIPVYGDDLPPCSINPPIAGELCQTGGNACTATFISAGTDIVLGTMFVPIIASGYFL